MTKGKNSLDRIVNFGIVISAVNDSASCGSVAQLVEQRTENPRVRGSTPFRATRTFSRSGIKLSGLFSFLYCFGHINGHTFGHKVSPFLF